MLLRHVEVAGDERPTDYETQDLVRRFFDTKDEAIKFYDELNTYRKFIRSHI